MIIYFAIVILGVSAVIGRLVLDIIAPKPLARGGQKSVAPRFVLSVDPTGPQGLNKPCPWRNAR